MNKMIGVILLVVGVFLLIRGHAISQSVNSQVKNLFTGSSSNQVMYYYVGGAVGCAVALVELFCPGKK